MQRIVVELISVKEPAICNALAEHFLGAVESGGIDELLQWYRPNCHHAAQRTFNESPERPSEN